MFLIDLKPGTSRFRSILAIWTYAPFVVSSAGHTVGLSSIIENPVFDMPLYLTGEGKTIMTRARFVRFRSSRVGLKKISWKNIKFGQSYRFPKNDDLEYFFRLKALKELRCHQIQWAVCCHRCLSVFHGQIKIEKMHILPRCGRAHRPKCFHPFRNRPDLQLKSFAAVWT